MQQLFASCTKRTLIFSTKTIILPIRDGFNSIKDPLSLPLPYNRVNQVSFVGSKRFYSDKPPKEPNEEKKVSLWTAHKEKYYYPDITFGVHIYWFLIPALLALIVSCIIFFLGDTKYFKSVKENAQATYRNSVLNKKLWTPFVSLFTMNFEFMPSLYALLCVFLYGSNVMKSAGLVNFCIIFFSSGSLGGWTSLIINHSGYLKQEEIIKKLQEGKELSEDEKKLLTEAKEKLKMIEATTLTHTYNQKKEEINKIETLSDLDLSEKMKDLYADRPSITTAGYLSLIVYFTLVNRYAKFPTNKIFFPYWLMSIVMVFYELTKPSSYDFSEVYLAMLPSFVIPSVIYLAGRGKVKIHKWNYNKLKRLEPNNEPINITQKVDKTDKLTQDKLNAMRKRNSKYQKK